jgi:hypothetical protein
MAIRQDRRVDRCCTFSWEYGDASSEVSEPILTEYWSSRACPDKKIIALYFNPITYRV